MKCWSYSIGLAEGFLRCVHNVEESIFVFVMFVNVNDRGRVANHAAVIHKQEECLVWMKLQAAPRGGKRKYCQICSTRRTKSQNVFRLILQWSLPNPLRPGVLSWQWRCSWSSADRRCSIYIWAINNFITYWGVAYIRGLTVNKKVFYVACHLAAIVRANILVHCTLSCNQVFAIHLKIGHLIPVDLQMSCRDFTYR